MIASDKGDDVPLRGGVEFKMNPIGTMYPKNLTPDPETGIGRYSDGQLFRMMRHAVKPDGTGTLSVMMPFWNMADDDLVAIVSYLRSMEPVRNEVPNAEWTFIGKMVHVLTPTFQPIIDPKAPATAPPMSPPSAARGEYLARSVANCVGCHTERDLMTYEAIGPEFAGGMEFEPFPDLYEAVGVDPDLWTRSPNLTPGPGSRFSQFSSVDEWKQRFRAGRTLKHSPMDWGPFSRMSDEDLESLWLFLKTVPPVEKDVGPIVYKKEE